ncbi:MAG: hypothetical protein PHQ05_14175 [Sterolibacterium sp.]|nr:hypothetical protein [Sterolibacterium sp.]
MENVKENKMNAPMMLPWLARKWGVSDAHALELWRQSCRYAEKTVGDNSSSRYWDVAKHRLINLLDNEVIARYPGTETPWIMIQLNFFRLLFWLGVKGHRFSPVLHA